MHINRDVFTDDLFGKWNESLRDPTQHDSRIRAGVDFGQRHDEVGGRGDPGTHREAKKLLFRIDMSQHGSRSDTQFRSDVRQSGRLEPLYPEDPPRGFKKLVPGDPRRASH